MDLDIELEEINVNLKSYYKRKAEIQAGILITDSIIKFSIAAILTAVISIFILSPFTTEVTSDMYIGHLNPLHFWGIVLIIIIIWLFGFSYIRRIQLSTVGFTTDIEIIRYENRFNEMRETAEELKKQREAEILEEKRRAEEKAKREEEERLEREQIEFTIISKLDEIIISLQQRSSIKRRTAAERFLRVCWDNTLRETENKDLISKVKTCLAILSPKLDKKVLKTFVQGFHSLTIESKKCTYFNMTKDNFYDILKSFITSQANFGEQYVEKIYHIFCNIAKLEDIDTLLIPFQKIEPSSAHIRRYMEYAEMSLFVHDYEDEFRNKIIEILEGSKIPHSKNLEDLKSGIIAHNKESIIRSNLVPRCKRKE